MPADRTARGSSRPLNRSEFLECLRLVKQPPKPPQGREEYLRLHPTCERCQKLGRKCEVNQKERLSVRCAGCLKGGRCPRQTDFEIHFIAKKLERSEDVVADMYDTYHTQVVGKFMDVSNSNSEEVIEVLDTDSEAEEGDRKIKRETIEKAIKVNRQPMRPIVLLQRRSNGAVREKVRPITDETRLRKLVDLNRRLALYRVFLHNDFKAFKHDRRLMDAGEPLAAIDSIGQEFSITLKTGSAIQFADLENLIGKLAVCQDNLSSVVDLLVDEPSDEQRAQKLRKRRDGFGEIVDEFGAVLDELSQA